MSKRFLLSGLLFAFALASSGLAPAGAIYQPCQQICPNSPAYANCSCPYDSSFPYRSEKCGTWQVNCY